MAQSFLEKLKKEMGINKTSPEKELQIEKTFNHQELMTEKTNTLPSNYLEKKYPIKKEKSEIKVKEIKFEETSEIKEENASPEEEYDKNWPQPEGQLAIDIYETEDDLVLQSAIAGVRPEELDISIEKDILTIRGKRKKPFEKNGNYFIQECYWGTFSREVILPVEVSPGQAEGIMKDGILTIKIPKLQKEKCRQIRVETK